MTIHYASPIAWVYKLVRTTNLLWQQVVDFPRRAGSSLTEGSLLVAYALILFSPLWHIHILFSPLPTDLCVSKICLNRGDSQKKYVYALWEVKPLQSTFEISTLTLSPAFEYVTTMQKNSLFFSYAITTLLIHIVGVRLPSFQELRAAFWPWQPFEEVYVSDHSVVNDIFSHSNSAF